MTRSQFLTVLYKKLLIPVLIIPVAWAAWLSVTFIKDTITSVDGSSFNFEGIFWFIVPNAVFVIALVLLRGVLNKLGNYISTKTGTDTSKNSKSVKILGRVVVYVPDIG
jgi:hypothetical protein